eukprot:403533-Rhodomonas_salina.1
MPAGPAAHLSHSGTMSIADAWCRRRCRITCGMTAGGWNTQLFSPCQGAARASIHSAPGSYHLALKRASCEFAFEANLSTECGPQVLSRDAKIS